MKILKPTAYYEPEQFSSSHLNSDLEKAFADAGYEYVIVAPTPSRGITNEQKKEYKNRLYEEKYSGRIKIYRTPMTDETSGSISRAFRYFWLCIKQYRRCVKENGINVIYAASTPPIEGMLAALIANRLSRKYNKKVKCVYNLQDVFPDSLINAGMTRNGSALWKIGRIIENYTYRHVDSIIVPSNDIRENIVKKGVPDEKISVIYNWVDETEITPIARDVNPLFDELGIPKEKFCVVYAGNIGASQGIETVLDCARLLSSKEDIVFLIFGDPEQSKLLQERANIDGTANLRFFPLQNRERIGAVYSMGDVNLIVCKPGVGRIAFPSKTWSILATGRPIIASYDSDTDLSRLIIQQNIGITCKPGDADALANAIIKMADNRVLRETMGMNGRSCLLKSYTKQMAVQQYLEVIGQYDADS